MCMMLKSQRHTKREPTPDLLELVAGHFRALAEPTRLAILHALADGERTVSELVEATGLGQGNLSKHLQQLHLGGFVCRRREGLFVYYNLADKDVLALCEIMCNRIEQGIDTSKKIVAGR
jgi:DNA-binding transcriptional ArsR family regulator